MNEARTDALTPTELTSVFDAQRRFFDSGATLPRAFREAQLRALIASVTKHERRIAEALWSDLHKSETEVYVTETSMLLNEARHTLQHLRQWMRPQRWVSPLVVQPSRSALHAQPLGPTLIIGAWNYPVQLSLEPLVAAIGAGNVAVVKPSELSPASSEVVAEIIRDAFSPEHVACVEGGVDTSTELLKLPWAHVFFTGGTAVGKVVARAAAEHLSRVTLELGGKSPCIIMPSANLDTAAHRIAWGKWVNAGQTCVAPDYLLVHEAIADELVDRIAARITAMYGADPQQSPDFCRIVSDRHFSRIAGLIDPAKVKTGGQTDAADRYIAPTILTGITMDDPVMGEEIFGPVLPVIQVASLEDAIGQVRRHPNPLALYLFTESNADRDAVVERVSFGGGCINNTLSHLADFGLPFGGVGPSGLGSYHGKWGFERFTHYKGMLESNATKLLDLPIKYAPYGNNLKLLKKVLG